MFADLGKLMQNMREMGARVREVQEKLKSRTVNADAGGGMVRVRMNGAGELVGLEIEKDAIDPEDPELLADLVMGAVNNARRKTEAMRVEAIRELTGGIDLSGMGIDLSGLMG